MKFSWIPYASQIGRLLKVILPTNMTVPILQGRLRGKKWIIGSGVVEMALGSYEYEKRLLFEARVCSSSVVYDIGAHVGFYTLLASQLVGPDGRVIAFEPVRRNLNYLRRHLEINHCVNVVVIEAAVSDRSGTAPFSQGVDYSQGYLSQTKDDIMVNTVSIDELVMSGEIPAPDYIKIDVEGAELFVLRGAKSTLSNCNVEIFLATHSPKIHIDCCDFLTSLNYKLKVIVGDDLPSAAEIFAYKE